jgi:hypothetical protein
LAWGIEHREIKLAGGSWQRAEKSWGNGLWQNIRLEAPNLKNLVSGFRFQEEEKQRVKADT